MYKKYLEQENVILPNDVLEQIKTNEINKTLFDNKNEILINEEIRNDMGVTKLEDGNYLVSMVCPMPNVTSEMIDWWFWWHAQDSVRYKLWYPGEHIKNSYSKKDKNYFNSEYKGFKNNTQYPVEKIGALKLPFTINFKDPKEFGFKINDSVSTIVCGDVGAFKDKLKHSKMAHIFFKREEGLFLVSRFWVGNRLKNNFIRRRMLTKENAIGMAVHCYIEYRNLSKKLPELYKEFK